MDEDRLKDVCVCPLEIQGNKIFFKRKKKLTMYMIKCQHGDPERLHNYHPWRYSQLDWTQPCASSPGRTCFEQGAALDALGFQRFLQGYMCSSSRGTSGMLYQRVTHTITRQRSLRPCFMSPCLHFFCPALFSFSHYNLVSSTLCPSPELYSSHPKV